MIERVSGIRWRGTLYSEGEASRAINEAIGKIICRMASALSQIDKYVATANYLEGSEGDMRELVSLWNDLAAIKRGDEC